MKENSIEKLQERLETLHVIQDARLACNADDLDIREEIAEVEDEIKELQDDINEKNNNGNDTNVGSIENSIKKCPCCGSEKLTYFKESVLTRYYKKEILFKLLVVLLSPIYFIFWIVANIIGWAMEIGEPIVESLQEEIEKMSSFWKEFFKRKK